MQATQAGDAALRLGEAANALGQDADPVATPSMTLCYTIKAADLAAFIGRTKRGRRQARGLLASAAFVSLMALNFLSGKLPVPQNGLGTGLEIATILGLPVAAAMWKLRHSRHAEAREMVPQPVDIRVDVFSDRAVEHRSDRPKPVIHRPRTAHALYRTRDWLAVESDHAVLVIPARAFSGKDAMAAMSARWDAQRA